MFLLPLLVSAPMYDSALTYLESSQNLRSTIQASGFGSMKKTVDFMVNATFSLQKSNFGDRHVTREIELSISGNYTPAVSMVYLSSYHDSWQPELVIAYSTGLFGEKICGFDSCILYSNLYEASSGYVSSTDEWDVFGAVYAPLDWYRTTTYCMMLNGTFAFSPYVSLRYSVPQGYQAGIENLTLTGNQIPPTLAQSLGAKVSSVPCFRVDIARDPPNLLALVIYATVPLIILWYVAVIDNADVKQRKDRMGIYVGALFASFGYFLSLRQYLQSIITLLDVLTTALMVGWIAIEAVRLLLQ